MLPDAEPPLPKEPRAAGPGGAVSPQRGPAATVAQHDQGFFEAPPRLGDLLLVEDVFPDVGRGE